MNATPALPAAVVPRLGSVCGLLGSDFPGACQLYQHRMSPWEREFVANLVRWGRRPSQKQLGVLSRLFERVA